MFGRPRCEIIGIMATIIPSILLPPPILWDARGLRVLTLLVGFAVEVHVLMLLCVDDGIVLSPMFHHFCLRVEVQANLDLIHLLSTMMLPFYIVTYVVLDRTVLNWKLD